MKFRDHRNEMWLKDSFYIGNLPAWPCPFCEDGFLSLENDVLNYRETTSSLRSHTFEDWVDYLRKFRFHDFLKCNKCLEIVSFLGIGDIDILEYYPPNEIESIDADVERFFPIFFDPPLHIFKINKKCPANIRDEIINSFKLYWSDLSSCANKIRIALELLMDQQKVKKIYLHRNKRKSYSLHNRIEQFSQTNTEIGEYLLAIKWIGNAGSHLGKLEKLDMFETYELLEHALNKLFDDPEKKLKRMTKEIIKRKGVRKRKN